MTDHIVSENAKNVFTQFYENPVMKRNKKGVVLSAVQQDIKNYKHKDAIEFAAASLAWTNNISSYELSKMAMPLKFHSGESGIRAYYRVIAEKRDAYILTACHVNIHGHHRGDLRFIEVNHRTVSRGTERFSIIGQLYLGDVLAVTELSRLIGSKSPGDVFNATHDANCYWMASMVTVLPRRILSGITFSMLENGTAVVKEQSEVMNVLNGELTPGKLYTGDAFLPEKFTSFFTEEHRSEFKNDLIAMCSKIHQYPNSLGTIFCFVESQSLSIIFDIGLNAFKQSIHPSDSIVETCVLMGYAAAISISNGRFDARPFPMQNTERTGPIVKFSIDNPPDKPTQGKWTINSRIRIGGPNGDTNAVIETVISDGLRLKISARLSRDVAPRVKFNDGVHIVSQREVLEAQILKKGFFSKIPSMSNGRRIIETLYGGNVIPKRISYTQGDYVFPTDSEEIRLNTYQCEYVDMLLDGNPMVVGSSPFGCGKSMTIVTAAYEIFKRDPFPIDGKKRLQLLVTQSNYASVNLVEIARKIKQENGREFKFVRYVSDKNWKELPQECLTESDLPTLMKRQFVLWAFGRCGSSRLESRHKTNMICFILEEKLMESEDFEWNIFRFYNGMDFQLKKSWFYDLLDAFLILFDPDVILTTADSLQGLLTANVLDTKSISTIQIDEASQVPEYTLISLLVTFPMATFGLIGDIQQLPPYCETGLDGKLKEYGIGNVMERAVQDELFPQAMLCEVYRCHPKTTNLLGELFYGGKLISGIQENQRSEFMRNRLDFWPNSEFPIIIVNNKARGMKMGTSYSNKTEKDLVKQILNCIEKLHNNYQLRPSDIGVISFYSAQTSLLTESLRGKGVKCGTVDAFQGSEKEVIILCCTNERISEFMQLSNRINVAMSRAKQVTVIVGNLNGLKKAEHWNRIVMKVVENGCVIETNAIGKLQQFRNDSNRQSTSNNQITSRNNPSQTTVPTPVEHNSEQPDQLTDQLTTLSVTNQSTSELVACLKMEKEVDLLKTELKRLQEKEWNMCEICVRTYQQEIPLRTPRILNCGHTFCQECASAMSDDSGITCPTCRVVTPGTADQLKTNFAIYKHV